MNKDKGIKCEKLHQTILKIVSDINKKEDKYTKIDYINFEIFGNLLSIYYYNKTRQSALYTIDISHYFPYKFKHLRAKKSATRITKITHEIDIEVVIKSQGMDHFTILIYDKNCTENKTTYQRISLKQNIKKAL